DRSFDFAFATSVFTHVLPETLRRYLHETRRVLRGGGILLSTFFLINEAALARGSQFVRCGDHYSGDPADPEQTTAYDEERVLAEIAGAGLSVEEVRAGTWPAEAGGFYQDVVIARRPVESGWRRLRGSPAGMSPTS
ncbi:MAG: methyltransferase domain-containing protein, partial [Gaiellaceae bacterium]